VGDYKLETGAMTGYAAPRIGFDVKATDMKNMLRCLLVLAMVMAGCARAPETPMGVAGNWSELGTGAILRLGSDGIVQVVTGVETTSGTYSVDSQDRMTLRFDGTAAATQGPLTVRYVLQGNRMTLFWPEGNTMQYTRLEK
jgi:hypothetical protein